ncbi:helix-turn-helix transcriptional regulator [Bacillaceae bacterium Marseille-Q3522]|nr:helix-turn-helix transcriptional regulator [Bacillaceae bacterium Marseille-Q3522]
MHTKKLVIHIHELIEKKNISLRELGRLADIDISQISPLAKGDRKRIDVGHIVRIAEALDIEDIREILTIENVDEYGA